MCKSCWVDSYSEEGRKKYLAKKEKEKISHYFTHAAIRSVGSKAIVFT